MTKRISLILVTGSALALAACAPMPYGTQPQLSKTQQGALVGAVAGGVLAAQRDDDANNKGADIVKGAVVGATAGAVVGNVLERQAAALQQSVSTPGIQIVNHGTHLSVLMPSSTLFAVDSAAVSGPGQNDLYAIARNLNEYPNSRIEVIGHTDNTGEAAYNLGLSQRRAQSVSGILTAAGVNGARVTTIGRGEDQPVASNQTESGRAQNRRVEILIRPTS